MSGSFVVNYLLSNDNDVVAAVPTERILNGVLPLNTALPAIGVTSISGVPRNTVAMNESAVLITERIQVTVQAKTYGALKSTQALIFKALATQRGTVNNVVLDAILPDLQGPDLQDFDVGLHQGSQDYIIRWKQSR